MHKGTSSLKTLNQTGLDRSATMLRLLEGAFAGVIERSQAQRIRRELDRDPVDRFMRRLVPLAAAYASPAISNFHVGAVAQGASGRLYLGFNMEYRDLSLGDSVHAEQAAIINAWSHGESRITKIVISAAPCGHCRQFMYEMHRGASVRIFTRAGKGVPLTSLLPSAFGPHDLGLPSGLLSAGKEPSLKPAPRVSDALMTRVYEAARRSYAPYSKGFAAAGLETRSNESVVGMYAENVAFNPSVGPMVAALVLLRLHGSRPEDLRRSTLVHAESPVDHIAKSRAVLDAIGGPSLEVHTVRASGI